MIREAIDRILALAQVTTLEIDGLKYTDRGIHPVQAPQDQRETVGTLTGLVSLIQADLNVVSEEPVFLHVLSPSQVNLTDLQCDEWGRRQIHAHAVLPSFGKFDFGNYLDQERFIIGLQAFFTQDSPDLEYVLRIAGALKADAVQTSDDDGHTQKVAVRTGVHLAENITIKRRVILNPFRTFREIDQPASEFIFRLRSREGEIPALALFTADGEMWQSTAMQSIKTWLMEQLRQIPVIA